MRRPIALACLVLVLGTAVFAKPADVCPAAPKTERRKIFSLTIDFTFGRRKRACSANDADGDGVADALDPKPHDADIDGVPASDEVGTPAWLRWFWPPSRAKFSIYAAMVAAAWALALSSVRRVETDADRAHHRRDLELQLSKLVQLVAEHHKYLEKREEYRERKAELEALARARARASAAAGPDAPASALRKAENAEYQALVHETGFIDEHKPTPLSPARVLDVLVDRLDDCAIDRVPGLRARVAAYIKPARVAEHLERFDRGFEACHAILFERLIDHLDDVMAKTDAARPDEKPDLQQPAYASGAKLDEAVKLAKRARRYFYRRTFLGLPLVSSRVARARANPAAWPKARAAKDGEPPAVDDPGYDAATEFLRALSRAIKRLKQIRGVQRSRLLALVQMLSGPTLMYASLYLVGQLVVGSFGAMRTVYSTKMATDATLPEWRPLIKGSIFALVVIHVWDWGVNDLLLAVSRTRMKAGFKNRLKKDVFEALLRQDTGYFDANDGGALQRALQHDTEEVAHKFLEMPLNLFSNIAGIISMSVVLQLKCPGMLTRCIAFAAATMPVVKGMMSLRNQLHRKGHRMRERIGNKTGQVLGSIRTVRESGHEAQEVKDFVRTESSMSAISMRGELINQLTNPTVGAVMFGGYLSNTHYGAGLAHNGELAATDLMQLSHTSEGFTHQMRRLVDMLGEIANVIIPAERVFTLLETESVIEPSGGSVAARGAKSNGGNGKRGDGAPFETRNGGMEIVYDAVTFAYPTMPEHEILRGFSLKIPCGKTVAFVGERGCGKSTAFHMIKRSYDPEPGCGEMVVNGRPLREWSVRDYRRHIATVSQKIMLFDGTIKENILFGLSDDERRAFERPSADGKTCDDKLQELAEKVAAWEFIQQFPLRFETRIGGKGVGVAKLSPGQQQCIAIARALVKKPAFLLLDEATSAMDAKTQTTVAETIAKEQAAHGFTIVQIAHRLDTLKSSDVLYYLAHGRVIEVAGAESLDHKAVDELLARDIKWTKTKDPKSGEVSEKVTAGFFHHLWDVEKGVQDHRNKSPAEIDEELEKLGSEIQRAEVALEAARERKRHIDRAKRKMKAVTHFIDGRRMSM